MSRLRFIRDRSFACTGRLRNVGTDCSNFGLYCVTITWQQIFKGSLQVAAIGVSSPVTVERRHLWQVMQRQWLLIAVSQMVLYYVKRSKDAGEQESDRGIAPCSFKRGRCLFHNSIMGNFMIWQDRIETNLLQLFAQQEDSELFSIISVIIF